MSSQDPAPLFTIITVCRNAEASIRRTVESVRSQADPGGAIEHRIVDGASTDSTLRILAGYSHLHVRSEPDAGLYDAMNKGISSARGRYIGILNADDWYEPDALARVAKMFETAEGLGIVHGDQRRWVAGRQMDVVRPPLAEARSEAMLMPVNHPATFVRADVYRQVGGFDLSYRACADFDWVKRAQALGVTFQYCPAILTNFSMGGLSTRRLLVRERYRSRRAHGAGRLATAAWLARTSVVVLRNRWIASAR